jgi:hypothetical protein
MATIANEPNGFWKGLAMGSCGIVVVMVGWVLVTVMMNSNANSNRLTAIEVELTQIKNELRRISP